MALQQAKIAILTTLIRATLSNHPTGYTGAIEIDYSVTSITLIRHSK